MEIKYWTLFKEVRFVDFRKIFEFTLPPLIREMSEQKNWWRIHHGYKMVLPWYHAFNNEFSDHVKLIFTHLLLFCRHMFPRSLLFSSFRGKYITKDPLPTFKIYSTSKFFLPKALVQLQLRRLWLSGFDKEPTTFSSCCIFNELHLTVCLRWTWMFCTLDWKQRVSPVVAFNERKYFFFYE